MCLGEWLGKSWEILGMCVRFAGLHQLMGTKRGGHLAGIREFSFQNLSNTGLRLSSAPMLFVNFWTSNVEQSDFVAPRRTRLRAAALWVRHFGVHRPGYTWFTPRAGGVTRKKGIRNG